MAVVIGVHAAPSHAFSKAPQGEIRLLEGLGVAGDAHAGVTVKHRSRVAKDPSQPNLRQVHLIQAELFDELAAKGFSVEPGQLGENVTTWGIDLLGLPADTLLRLGDGAVVRVTGLRNPCAQIDGLAPGLMQAVLEKSVDGRLIRKAGVMGVVERSGTVRRGDTVSAVLPAAARPLEPV